jgi:glyoxylase-like metal-dependent hydrolase (beta-lactamase superfamily II)
MNEKQDWKEAMLKFSAPKTVSKYFDTCTFHLGDFQISSVLDGLLFVDCASIFNGAPYQELAVFLNSYNLSMKSTLTIPWTMLYIDTGKNKVLIDTGMSKTFVDMDPGQPDEVRPENLNWKPRRELISQHPVDCGHLLENLRYMDIKAPEIDTVIITHAHADHIGGLVDPRTDKPAFPNAQVVMWKEEWQFYMENPDALSRLNKLSRGAVPESAQLKFAHQCLEPIKNQLTLIDSEQIEIVPGIRYINAHGHSYMMGVIISSGKEKIIHFADTAIHPIQLEELEWLYSSDLNKEQAATSRRRLCEWAVTNDALVASPHFPFPGIGHVIRKRPGYQWQPINIK